jgi:hypothetical protein
MVPHAVEFCRSDISHSLLLFGEGFKHISDDGEVRMVRESKARMSGGSASVLNWD